MEAQCYGEVENIREEERRYEIRSGLDFDHASFYG